MIRTLAAVAALASLPALAHAQPYDYDPNGIVVQAQPRDAYVITISTAGKDESTVRQEIWDAANTACDRAPVDNPLDLRLEARSACVAEAEYKALSQFKDIRYGSGYAYSYNSDYDRP